MMLLTAQELLKIINGDGTPEELEELLDRLDRCADSARALKALVTLRAHREEAMKALCRGPRLRAPSRPLDFTPSSGALIYLAISIVTAAAAMLLLWWFVEPVVPTP